MFCFSRKFQKIDQLGIASEDIRKEPAGDLIRI